MWRVSQVLKYTILFLIIQLSLSSITHAETIPPSSAGTFYPASSKELAYLVNDLLKSTPKIPLSGEVVALIMPHAGYQFSGQVAAFGYKHVVAKSFDRVIIIGNSHHLAFDKIALPSYDSFATPLGELPVDLDFIDQLTKLSSNIVMIDKPFENEHSIEVQLPFLLSINKNFKIVPILFGQFSQARCQELAAALKLLIQDGDLVIASSDWSHYYPYDLAKKMDTAGIKSVCQEDVEKFLKQLVAGETEACGAPVIVTTMLLAPSLGANKIELLKYANSGDVTGDKGKIVGYAAIAYVRQDTLLSDQEKNQLLKIARQTLTAKLAQTKLPEFKVDDPRLTDKSGVFVTLNEANQLRGCIGYIQPVRPLFQAVQEMSVAAALKDQRFFPVSKSELKDIKIEISVLTQLIKVKNLDDIKIGRDGLYIEKGLFSGLLLPQVPIKEGWTKSEYLKQLCLKAGLPESAWKDKATNLFRFEAQVFSEK